MWGAACKVDLKHYAHTILHEPKLLTTLIGMEKFIIATKPLINVMEMHHIGNITEWFCVCFNVTVSMYHSTVTVITIFFILLLE